MNVKLTAERLRRRALVYIRQSSPGQVLHNQESQRRQYALVDHARVLGFHDVDEAVAHAVLEAIGGNAVEAALAAADQLRRQREEQRQALALEVEQAQYEARLAARRYEAVDPDNRLVAAELEARWNRALQHARMLEEKLHTGDQERPAALIPDRAVLVSLAQDLPSIWRTPTTDMRLKQRIVRLLIQEIVADVDEAQRVIALLIHWAGGRHSELRVKKNEPGRHGRSTSLEAIDVVRQMAGPIS